MFTTKSTAECYSAVLHEYLRLSSAFKMRVKRFQKYRLDVSHENLKNTTPKLAELQSLKADDRNKRFRSRRLIYSTNRSLYLARSNQRLAN